MKTKFQIKSVFGNLLFEYECESLKEAVCEANLRGVNLSGANLRGVNLSGVNLSGVNLYGADLYGADLYGANLRGADLREANLYGANLYGANLYGANLRGADLYGANLYGAVAGAGDDQALHGSTLAIDPAAVLVIGMISTTSNSITSSTGAGNLQFLGFFVPSVAS
jgi:uncharacterized protein YjbI with pentapeptide repeats